MTHDPAAAARFQALYVSALTNLRDGRPDLAGCMLRDALDLVPGHPGARKNLVRALFSAGDHAAVRAETETLADADAETLFLRGTALNALSRPREARAVLAAAVALDPSRAPAWLNLGNALADLDDAAQAEAHYREALRRDPGLAEALVSLGFILTVKGAVTEAIAVLERTIAAHPDHAQAHWNLAVAYLLAGDLPRGFAEYEWRKRHDRFRRDFIDLPGPVWDGGDPAGRTILVHAEQGLGDTIQFARYLAPIAARGGRPVLACEPALIPLLRTAGPFPIVSKFAPLPEYGAWIDQMSLPRVLGTRLDTIPAAAGYLSADPALAAAHRALLPSGRCIGLAWAGNPLHRNDRRRSPPAEAFVPLLARAGCRFINLVPDRNLPGTEPPPRPLTDYAETAALISVLDGVIAVDTSVAHVAGALGVAADVLLPHAPDWRWLLNRSDSPWYASLRLHRQPAPGDWASVIGTLAV